MSDTTHLVCSLKQILKVGKHFMIIKASFYRTKAFLQTCCVVSEFGETIVILLGIRVWACNKTKSPAPPACHPRTYLRFCCAPRYVTSQCCHPEPLTSTSLCPSDSVASLKGMSLARKQMSFGIDMGCCSHATAAVASQSAVPSSCLTGSHI